MSGADTSYVKGGGAGLPTAAGADEVPVSTGAGTTYTATPLAAAVGDTLAGLYGALDAGDFYVSDGAGVVPASSVASTVRAEIGVASIPTAGVDASRPAATVATLGAIYTGTDTGVRYLCESDGAGGARWVVSGARGTEGRDTTAVQCAATNYGTSSVSLDTSTIRSWALVFSQRSIPVATQVLATIDVASTGIELADIGRQSGDRYLLSVFRPGSWTGGMALTGATISASPTTVHCLACTISGSITRYSLDGAVVATVDHGAGSASSGTTTLRLGAGSGGANIADSWLFSLVVWSTAVSDADLAIVSGSAKAGGATPGRIPAVSGATEIVRWHAASTRAGVVTDSAVGTLGGTLTWNSAPVLVIR